MYEHPITFRCANGCGATCAGELSYREIVQPIPGVLDGAQVAQIKHARPTDPEWSWRTFKAGDDPAARATRRAGLERVGTARLPTAPAQEIANATGRDQADWVCATCSAPERPA